MGSFQTPLVQKASRLNQINSCPNSMFPNIQTESLIDFIKKSKDEVIQMKKQMHTHQNLIKQMEDQKFNLQQKMTE